MSMTATCFAALGALLTLENPRTGMRVTFSDDGARFVAVEVRDRAGALRTVTAPPIDPFSGATLGRVANRIAETLLVTPDEVMARTTANARRLFNL